jgi:hypothetical protein
VTAREWLNVIFNVILGFALPVFLFGALAGWLATEWSYGAEYRRMCLAASELGARAVLECPVDDGQGRLATTRWHRLEPSVQSRTPGTE